MISDHFLQKGTTMKKSVILLILVTFTGLAIQAAHAQSAVATQSLSLAVDAVYKIATSGNPAALAITTGTAGVDALTSVSDATTTYSITQNYGNAVKITGNLDATLPSGYRLQIDLASSKGTSAGAVDISNATSGTAADVVTAIAAGSDANKSITYTFSALASAGTLASSARTVTLTLTN